MMAASMLLALVDLRSLGWSGFDHHSCDRLLFRSPTSLACRRFAARQLRRDSRPGWPTRHMKCVMGWWLLDHGGRTLVVVAHRGRRRRRTAGHVSAVAGFDRFTSA